MPADNLAAWLHGVDDLRIEPYNEQVRILIQTHLACTRAQMTLCVHRETTVKLKTFAQQSQNSEL
jgi:hypothetical protein